MAENGAALQSYNNELVKCIEDLCSKRDDVSREIKMDEQEKEKLEHDIAILHERLQKVVTNLARKTQIRDEYGNFSQKFSFLGHFPDGLFVRILDLAVLRRQEEAPLFIA